MRENERDRERDRELEMWFERERDREKDMGPVILSSSLCSVVCWSRCVKYGVATISRVLKIIGLFCKRAL